MRSSVKLGPLSQWQPLEKKLIQVGDRPVLVFRLGDKLKAYDDRCPHRAGPLSEGLWEDGQVTCPWHRAQFSLETGECRSPGFRCRGLIPYRTQEDEGEWTLTVVLDFETQRNKQKASESHSQPQGA